MADKKPAEKEKTEKNKKQKRWKRSLMQPVNLQKLLQGSKRTSDETVKQPKGTWLGTIG